MNYDQLQRRADDQAVLTTHSFEESSMKTKARTLPVNSTELCPGVILEVEDSLRRVFTASIGRHRRARRARSD